MTVEEIRKQLGTLMGELVKAWPDDADPSAEGDNTHLLHYALDGIGNAHDYLGTYVGRQK